MASRINIGCGQTPIQGWRNFDNSFSLRLSKIPLLPEFLHKIYFLESAQYQFIRFCSDNNIEYGNVLGGLPVQNQSVEVLYSSHMLFLLDRDEADKFCKEAFRVLCRGGIIRLAVPDIKKLIDRYNESGDVDALLESTLLCKPRPKSLAQKLSYLLLGPRNNNQWLYDGKSIARLLQKHGFIKTEVMSSGRTRISGHEPLNLYERAPGSIYVEAEKPND